MKPIITFSLMTIFFLSSCTKDTLVFPESDSLKNKEAPDNFTKKVIMETLEAAWCPYSPEGDFIAAELKTKYGERRLEYITYHLSDPMDVLWDNPIISKYLSGNFPNGNIDRMSQKPFFRNEWEMYVSYAFTFEAKCGLEVDATEIDAETLTVRVRLAIGAEDIVDGGLLSVILLEKETSSDDPAYDQYNSFNNHPGHPFYQKGHPIKGYIHRNRPLGVLTPVLGDVVDNENLKAGKLSEYIYSIDISKFDSDLRVVAFVTANNPTKYYNAVYNSQFVDVGSVQLFD